MKKLFIVFVVFGHVLISSCKLNSTTLMKANESFVLGDNTHGNFQVKLKNTSKNSLELWKMNLTGGQHSPLKVKPNETVKVKINSKSALRINNQAKEQASVELQVKGDINLSMSYMNN